MMALWESRNMQHVWIIKVLFENIVATDDPSVCFSTSCVNCTVVYRLRKIDQRIRDDQTISIHEIASETSISCTAFIPCSVTSFLNMQDINGPRHELSKPYFHYEYHTDRVPITPV
jgi:hypothetical protein